MTPMQPGQKPKVSAGVLAVLIGGGLSLFCCLGTVAAIALPSFLRVKRPIQSEVKTNLKAAYTAEKAYYGEKDTYSESLEEVGFLPERKNRYRYFLSARGDLLIQGAPDGGAHSSIGADLEKDVIAGNVALEAGVPSALLGEAGIKGKCPECEITIIAAGNLDSDPIVDVWSISTMERTIGTERVPPGVPHCHVNDLD